MRIVKLICRLAGWLLIIPGCAYLGARLGQALVPPAVPESPMLTDDNPSYQLTIGFYVLAGFFGGGLCGHLAFKKLCALASERLADRQGREI